MPIEAIGGDIDSQTLNNNFAYLESAAAHLEDLLYVDAKRFGAIGDGIADDTTALEEWYDYCVENHKIMYLPNGTFLFKPSKTSTDMGGSSVLYLFEAMDEIVMRGNGSTIKLKDGVSTDADPVDISVFYRKEAKTTNFDVRGIIFDLNGANNPISPGRLNGNYNRIKHAIAWWEGDGAGCENFTFKDNTVKNSNGVNSVVMGRANTSGSAIYKNAVITQNYFYNNGMDTDDHTTVYMWIEEADVFNNRFHNPYTVPSNPSAYELHGSNSKFHDNIVTGHYQRGGYIGGNYTNETEHIDIYDNTFVVSSGGSNLFRNANQLPVRHVHFYDNTVVLNGLPVANTVNEKFGFLGRADYGVEHVSVYHNKIVFTDPTYNNFGVSVGNGEVNNPMIDINIYENEILYAKFGVECRTYAGADYVNDLHVYNNKFYQCTERGVSLRGNTDYKPKRFVITGNKFIETTEGIFLAGEVTTLLIENNEYEGLAGENIILQNAVIDNYEGAELKTFEGVPAAGTWRAGERIEIKNPAPGYFSELICTTGGSPGEWYGVEPLININVETLSENKNARDLDAFIQYIDGGGINRNFTPTGSFTNGKYFEVCNTGTNDIFFDPLGINVTIPPDSKGTFVYFNGWSGSRI